MCNESHGNGEKEWTEGAEEGLKSSSGVPNSLVENVPGNHQFQGAVGQNKGEDVHGAERVPTERQGLWWVLCVVEVNMYLSLASENVV